MSAMFRYTAVVVIGIVHTVIDKEAGCGPPAPSGGALSRPRGARGGLAEPRTGSRPAVRQHVELSTTVSRCQCDCLAKMGLG